MAKEGGIVGTAGGRWSREQRGKKGLAEEAQGPAGEKGGGRTQVKKGTTASPSPFSCGPAPDPPTVQAGEEVGKEEKKKGGEAPPPPNRATKPTKRQRREKRGGKNGGGLASSSSSSADAAVGRAGGRGNAARGCKTVAEGNPTTKRRGAE